MARFIFSLLALVCCCGCRQEAHFITDAGYRGIVEQDFANKKELLSASPENVFAVFDQPLTQEEREALEFLYAYSPLVDLTVYGGDFLLDNVRMSLQVREEMPWGKNIPEDIFRHFVLPVRGHNEGLDSARRVFYGELHERVKSCKDMEKAALEVNHWCHEKAIYRPTNARTCAPLTMITTTYGRCGEESVFALAAMRSVGIPARQVYTPRWAHCDDNHAWIEVWVDGKWKYLGACEPEPRLNIAWFTAPVKRGLYMEARVFGKYLGDEEVVDRNNNLTSVNVTGNYTDAKKAVVVVTDTAGNPVPGARVEYRIYNYGEFYPAVTLTADKNGLSALTVGLGDWLVWASKDGLYGFDELQAATMDTVRIVLNKTAGAEFQADYDIVPPGEKEYEALTTDEERAVNDRRFMYEDSLRGAYIATFMQEDEALGKAREWEYEPAAFAGYVKAARGNGQQILDFLAAEKEAGAVRKLTAMELLGVLAEKDLQDITADVLEDHLGNALVYKETPRPENCSPAVYAGLFREYILNPRVKNEFISAFRAPLKEYLERENIRSAEELLEAMSKILVVDSVNTINVATAPSGVLKTMLTDTRSKELFFVAACRTMGIPARLNPVDGKPEYNPGQGWIPVVLTPRQTVSPKGKVMVHLTGTSVADPVYYTNFTISRIENGQTRLIDLGSNSQVDMGGGLAYSAIFRQPVELEGGDYVLVTGNRKSDGSVLSGLTLFSVEPGKTTDVPMAVRDASETVKVLGTIDIQTKFVREDSTAPEALILPKSGYTALAFIAANKEPVNHLVRDMSGMKADFEQKGVPMMFLFEDREQMAKFSRHDFRPLPDNMLLGYDSGGETLAMLTERLQLKNAGNLPLILMVNRKGEVVFISQGYRIGLGNQIMKFMDAK